MNMSPKISFSNHSFSFQGISYFFGGSNFIPWFLDGKGDLSSIRFESLYGNPGIWKDSEGLESPNLGTKSGEDVFFLEGGIISKHLHTDDKQPKWRISEVHVYT